MDFLEFYFKLFNLPKMFISLEIFGRKNFELHIDLLIFWNKFVDSL